MADVEIKYKGASIAALDASGTKTLKTAGKYCEDDISVSYIKSAVPAETNYRRFVGTIQSTVTGGGTEVLLAEDEIIGQVSELDSLLVRLSTDFAGNDAYTLLGAISTGTVSVLGDGYTQFIKRIGATSGVSNNRTTNLKITNGTNIIVGQLLIVGNQLKWIVHSPNYAVRPCNYVVEVMW